MFCELMTIVDDMMTTGDDDSWRRICAELETMNQRCGAWLTLLLFEGEPYQICATRDIPLHWNPLGRLASPPGR